MFGGRVETDTERQRTGRHIERGTERDREPRATQRDSVELTAINSVLTPLQPQQTINRCRARHRVDGSRRPTSAYDPSSALTNRRRLAEERRGRLAAPALSATAPRADNMVAHVLGGRRAQIEGRVAMVAGHRAERCRAETACVHTARRDRQRDSGAAWKRGSLSVWDSQPGNRGQLGCEVRTTAASSGR